MPVSRALAWSAFWVGLSVAFGFGVWAWRGGTPAAEFFTGYLLEKSLSVDNLFVFMIIFRHFQVPEGLQHRVLRWGIIGAVVLRALMIFIGIELINLSHAVLYVFGGFLIVTGLRTLWHRDEEKEEAFAEKAALRLARRVLPLVPRFDGERFFTRENGKRVGTVLLLTLFTIEISDVIFAVDSIPAIFAVTTDPFIVFSSNILAILGLRALYFALAGMLKRLRYLHFGLGAILILIGVKMCLSDLVHLPAVVSLAITVIILAVTVAASLLMDRHDRLQEAR
jgi:tellurite resistance protein TerC